LTRIEWLVREFGITAADAKADGGWLVYWTLFNGHRQVAEWAAAEFGLAEELAAELEQRAAAKENPTLAK
jgi:hypothetical protein